MRKIGVVGLRLFALIVFVGCVFFSTRALYADEVPCFWDENECESGSCESHNGVCLVPSGSGDCVCCTN